MSFLQFVSPIFCLIDGNFVCISECQDIVFESQNIRSVAFLSIEMVQEQIVRYRKRSVSPSAKLSNKLIRSVKSFSCISLPTDSPFFCEKS